MNVVPTSLPGVLVVEPRVFADGRGHFFESYHQDKYRAAGIATAFVQDNQSRSLRGTVRGLHMQVRRPQAKLVRTLQGEILDVAVDLRVGSPTFAKWTSAILSSDNLRQMFVPEGFAHGFAVLSEFAEVEYKCGDFYDPGGELGVRWNDPALGIDWRTEEPILSEKDRTCPLVAEVMERLPRFRGANT